MNVTIEKITNGYVTTVDGVKIFHDIPEAICGHMAELVLAHCKRLDDMGSKGAADNSAQAAAIAAATAQLQQQQQTSWAEMVGKLSKEPYRLG